MESFIAALGTKYDNDARIGYITAGLLGEWGEWHNWPRDELFASKETQRRVLVAYQNAFKSTPILLRYPAGKNDDGHYPNADLPFGFHDDSFAWGTLKTDDPGDSWYYMSLIERAGQDALDKWKTQPIGGEIRPEIWGQIFDLKPKHRNAQDFLECVRVTHASWLMDSGMFGRKQSEDRVQRAKQYIQKMGYDFHVQEARLTQPSGANSELSILIVNQGVAPFYRDWELELGFYRDGKLADTQSTDWTLKGIMPEFESVKLQTTLGSKYRAGDKILLRVVNPLANGKPLRFANESQDQHVSGWLTLN